MILIDTSVWIDYFHGEQTKEVDYLSRIVEQNEDLCLTGIILTEILQGISQEKEYEKVKKTLDALIFLPLSIESYVLAATIYRDAKQKGLTIRNTTDCLIAACAIAHEIPLLHNDRDYLTISKISKLKLIAC